MADELDVLLDKVDDHSLRAQLRAEIDKVRAKRTFGLVFESHLPERVVLPEHPVRRGAKVVRRDDRKSDLMRVAATRRGEAKVEMADGETASIPTADLVVVAEFGEPVYPGLSRLGSINRGGDKPAHLVINAENHHALEMLQFTHAGKVDCIYIDPPYNTGAKDWKYDNNYVDSDDAYRHSKWLAFMERRLLLAKPLLNPDNSVLIVTIDEKEYLRLGLLLQQTFPEARHQMVSIVMSPSGSSRDGLSRVDEYAFFCFFGSAQPSQLTWDLLDDRPAGDAKAGSANVRWEWLLRGGGAWYRTSRPNLCYPVVLSKDGKRIVSAGDPFTGNDENERCRTIDGHPVAWPVRSDGRLGIWRVDRTRLLELVESGYAYVSRGSADGETWTLRYLLGGAISAIESGDLRVIGRGERGEVLVQSTSLPTSTPKTVWKSTRHIAGGAGGTQLLTTLLGERNRFTYPKSLYAVEDSLGVATADNADAVILDFFAGSGTTAHAVMRLNRQDGGRRQAIVVTNNEVSVDEAKALADRGLRDGDSQWESLGIYEHITRPRIAAAVTGLTPDGTPIKGDYKFTDEFPMADGFEENVEFVKLTYLDPVDVELDRAFDAVAPLLWMRGGGQGSMIERRNDSAGDPAPFAVADRYGVLFDPDRWREFVQSLPGSARVVFVVTDSAAVFAGVAEQLPEGLEAVRLYENYLTTFAINRGGGS